LQQVEEEEASEHHGDANKFDLGRTGGIGSKDGGDELGGHSEGAGKGDKGGNLEWHSLAGEAQEAIRILLQEQMPGIGYCHECGGWHELPKDIQLPDVRQT
jgi:hypothetical protein